MTGKQRLKVLARYLCSGAVDESGFNMTKWPQCAIGEGTRIPSLAKEGLELETDFNGKVVPNYDGDTNFFAISQFFNISHDDAYKFFGPKKRSAISVGKRLLKYLNVV